MGFFLYKDSDGYYFKDVNGTLLNNERYDSATGFVRGYSLVKKNSKMAILKDNGKYMTDYLYDRIEFPIDDYCVVINDNMYGIINIKGNTILNCIYDKIYLAQNGQAYCDVADCKNIHINLNDTKSNKNNEIKSSIKNETGYIISKKDGKYTLINLNGNAISNHIYDNITLISKYLYLLWNNNKFHIFNIKRKELLKKHYYSDLYSELENYSYLTDENGYKYLYHLDNGLNDFNGMEFKKCVYDKEGKYITMSYGTIRSLKVYVSGFQKLLEEPISSSKYKLNNIVEKTVLNTIIDCSKYPIINSIID